MADHPLSASDSDLALEHMLEKAAEGTDGERLEALEKLYAVLERELEDNRGQAGPPRR